MLPRMIPWLWVRLAIVIAFGIWLTTTEVAWLSLVCVLLAALTGWQLYTAYRAQ